MEPQHSSGQSQSVVKSNPYGSYAYTSHDSVRGKGCLEPGLQGKKGHYSAAAYILWIIVGGTSFLLAATTGHTFIPYEEGKQLLKEQVPNLEEWYDRSAFVFFTAFVMDLLNMFFERNSTRSELVMLPCFIKGLSCANNLLLCRGFGLVLLDVNGRPLVVQRFLQWMVTTPTMLVLLSLSCKMTPRTLLRTIVMDEGMIVTGIMASIIPGILGHVSAALSYGCFLVVLWDMHYMFSSAMEEAAAQDKRVARLLWISELHSMVIWVGFGVVWTLGHFELISIRWEELGLLICDFLAKVVFSESLMLGSLKAMEVRRLVAMRAIEDTGKQRLIEELREMVQQKERFMSNVSHELRTPLNGIIGLSEGLLGGSCGELAEDVQKQVTIIRTSGARLLAFINDVMDAAALKRGRLKLKQEVGNLERIVQDVLALTRPLVKDAVRLQGIIPRHVHVICDPGRLIQVLNNLLGNAAKFTSVGSILVSCEETKDVVAVSVADTGVGIPEQAIPYIFMPFAQVDADTSRTYGGTGLGLSIVQELVTAQGGSIKVKSKVGEGSVFTFTLPRATAQTEAPALPPPTRGVRTMPPMQPAAVEQLALPEEGAKTGMESWSLPRVGWWSAASDTDLVKVGGSSSAAEEERASTPPPTGSEEEPLLAPQSGPSQRLRLPTPRRLVHRDLHDSYQVLSVDDDEVNHAVLESLLCPAGFEVVKALDGTAALDFLKSCSVLPDIILLDIMMPGLSGYEVCKRIREMLPDTPLPIIMVTAKSLEEDVVRGLHAGATDCLAKPFWGKELLARMEAHLRTSQLQREENSDQSALTAPHTTSSRVTILCIDDDEVSHLVMKGILHDKVYNYERALTGREAIERLKGSALPPDLVLLDLNLPDVSGFEVITQIRQLYPRKNIPVIMVSGNADEHFVVKGLKSGCNDYITKPFRREEMLARIETNLRIKFQALSKQIKEDAVSSMELLQRILPDTIIQRLQQGEKLIADMYKDAVVLVASFPSLADVLADCDVPTAMIFVNHLATAFDRLAENHQLCTVDCVGVDYVAVAPGRHLGRSAAAELEAGSASPQGMREEDARAREEGSSLPVERVYLCALAMMDVAHSVQLPQAMSRAKELGRGAVQVPAKTQGLELKLSIHLGPVWAGLVGSRCPKYSFIGTTMQQALELNSFAVPGSVLVSEAAAVQLRQTGERLRPLPEKDLTLRFSQPLSLLQVGDYMLAESELPTAASSVPGMDAEAEEAGEAGAGPGGGAQSMIEEVEDLKDMLADTQNRLQASQSNLKVATLEKRQLQRALNREQQRLKAAQGVVGQLEDDLRHLTREAQGRGAAAPPTLWPAHAPTVGHRASLGSHAAAVSAPEQGAVLEEAEQEEEEEVGVAEEGSGPLLRQPSSRRVGGASFASASKRTPSDRPATPQGAPAVGPRWPREPPPPQAPPSQPPPPPPPPSLPAARAEEPVPLSPAAVEPGTPEVSQLRDEVQQLRQQLESVQRRAEQRPERTKGLRKRFNMFRS